MEVKLLLGRPTFNLRIQWLRVRAAPGALCFFMKPLEPSDELIRLLLPRLERISVDSHWAHRASGVRGALVKMLDQFETGVTVDPKAFSTNITMGFEILKEAAEEYM